MAWPKLAATNIDHRFYSLEEFFSSTHAAGYEYAEIWTGPMHFRVDHVGHDPVEKICALSHEYHVKVIGFAPEQNNPKPGNIAAAGEAAGRTFQYFCNVIDAAAELDAPQVVVSSGWSFYDEPVDAARNRAIAMLRALLAYADEKGVTLAIEALQPEETRIVNTAAELERFVADVDRSSLKVCLDTGAMERAGDTIEGYFDLFGEKIVHCHLVDYGEVSHLSWGDGHRDMRDDLEALVACGYQGICSIESYNECYFADPASADLRTMSIYRQATEGALE